MAALPADFRAGCWDIAPVVATVVPYGLVVGATAVDAGFTVAQAVSFAALVNAGAAQLAAIGLLDAGTPLAVVVLTALVINVRMVMYSASLAPHLDSEPLGWRAAMAHVVIDPSYALAVIRFEEDAGIDRRWYFLGLGLPALAAWIGGTALGAGVGARLPEWLPLSFAVPMVFLALLFSAMDGRASRAAGVTGAAVAVLGVGLPFNLGLVVGAVVGVLAGLAVERRGDA